MPSKKRKAGSTAPAEITFDFAAREDWLTGFHKRKQARIKHAQEEAQKKEYEEKLKLRREMRQQRKEDLEKHVSEVNALLLKAHTDIDDINADAGLGSDEEEEFNGFDSDTAQEPQPIDQENEYIDEDKYTTITIESVDISKDGFEKQKVEGEEEKEEVKPVKEKRVWTKEFPKTKGTKKKKKKFRYESPADRKATRMKQGAKNRAAASARKAA